VSRLLGAKPLQNGYVVRDLHESIRFWTEVLGVGPFFIVEKAVLEDYEAWGRPTSIDLSVALAMTGGLQIELIQQHNDADTPYTRFLSEFGEGMQHIGYYTWDFDADRERLEQAGLTAIQSGVGKGSRMAYYDAGGPPGSIIELSELTPGKQAFFEKIAETAQNWDGRDPVRIRS
jgi:catechol 2,3-dioxygenase-like lactoylglutathione lyase family enzyme